MIVSYQNTIELIGPFVLNGFEHFEIFQKVNLQKQLVEPIKTFFPSYFENFYIKYVRVLNFFGPLINV